MALMNEVQIGRYQHLLERLLALKGSIATQQLSPELLPVLNLGNDRPEWLALGGEKLAHGYGLQAAVAGERSTVQLFNVTPGTIVTLEQFWVRQTNNSIVFYGHWDTLASGAGAAEGTHALMDGRMQRGPLVAAATVYTYHAVGNPIVTVVGRPYQTTTTEHYAFPVVLTYGTGFAVCADTVNTTLTVMFSWRERKIEPQEDTLGT